MARLTLKGIAPAPGIAGVRAYSVPKHGAPIDLKLDANEGDFPSTELIARLFEAGPELMRLYPDTSALQRLLAQRLGIDSAQLLVTCGGDDALDRLCRAVLAPGRELLTTDPSFEMLPRYAKICGATITEVDWPSGPFPTTEIINKINPDTKLIAVVSPNNPSGAVATAEDFRRISAAAPEAILLADFAYIEFADEDLTQFVMDLPNTVIVRTLSKAWGLAGLRVGYAIGAAELMGWMRAAGGPYAVARPSIALATARVESDKGQMAAFVEQVRADRAQISRTLLEYGATVTDSQGNFVLALSRNALWLRDALAGLGIAVRAYPGHPRLSNALRITCPGDPGACHRLVSAIAAALGPQMVVLNFDSVLTDTAVHVHNGILLAIGRLGIRATMEDLEAARHANPDATEVVLIQWIMRFRASREVPAADAQVAFDAVYFGGNGLEGVALRRKLKLDRTALEALGKGLPLALITHRPLEEAVTWLLRSGLETSFESVLSSRDHAPAKLLPETLRSLGLTRAWLVSDSPADMRAARSAGMVALGMVAPDDRQITAAQSLTQAGAARVLENLNDLRELLP